MSKVLTITEESVEDTWECRSTLTITVSADGKELHQLVFADGEQEDNNLSRGFDGCWSITTVLATVANYVADGYTVEFN